MKRFLRMTEEPRPPGLATKPEKEETLTDVERNAEETPESRWNSFN